MGLADEFDRLSSQSADTDSHFASTVARGLAQIQDDLAEFAGMLSERGVPSVPLGVATERTVRQPVKQGSFKRTTYFEKTVWESKPIAGRGWVLGDASASWVRDDRYEYGDRGEWVIGQVPVLSERGALSWTRRREGQSAEPANLYLAAPPKTVVDLPRNDWSNGATSGTKLGSNDEFTVWVTPTYKIEGPMRQTVRGCIWLSTTEWLYERFLELTDGR
ncbi:hypothetical protein CH278_12840 [Rhodococcus sp. 05-2254-5]|nr:hypothetical protein CH278_12840 [Rhodococcus sp. 05-2254-5]OZE51027.1 hypothetical protein CH269_25785 [Rhodococcus sp. 05-2254-1]